MKSSDFSTFIADRTHDFVGRDWVFAELDTWLADSNGPRTFFLAGGPGSGKSAVAARLVQMNAGEIPSTDYPRLGKDRLAFFHFCRAQVDTSLVPQRWIESLAVALARRYPVYAQALTGGAFAISEQALNDARTKGVPESVLKQLSSLRNINVLEKEELLPRIQTLIGEKAAAEYRRLILDHLIQKQVRHPSIEINATQTVGSVAQEAVVKNVAIESLHVGRLSPRVSFDEVVRLPLEVLCVPDFNETIVILLEGLDEALTYGQENLVSLIADVGSHAQDLPAQVRFLFTSRPDPRVIHAIGKPLLDLIDDAPDDLDDVGKYIDGRLCKLPEAQRREWAVRIAGAGSGNFLYVRYVLDDLLDVDGLVKPVADLRLPNDLQDVYRQFLKRELGRTVEEWSGRYQKLLGVVAVSRDDGLTGEQIANVTDLPQSETDSILRACTQYLAPSQPEGPFRIYHESFREFLLSDATFRIYPEEAHFAIASFYLKEYEEAWSQCDEDYALRHTLTHLIGAFRSATRRKQQQTIRAALARILTNLSFLERKALKIGIDAIRSDLSSLTDEALLEPKITTILKSILYILESNAKTLSSWDTVRHPHFFVQQIYLSSMRLKALPVVQLCEEHLRRMESGYLRMVWMSEMDSPELERTLLGQHVPVVQAAATSDGKWIVSQTNTHDVIVWQLESGRQMHRLGDQRSRNAWRQPITVAFTQDSRYAIIESSWWITAWDLQTGKNVQSARIENASWTSSQKGGIWPLDHLRLLHWIGQGWKVLDAETLQTLQTDKPLKIPAEKIAAAAVTADGRRAIFGSEDGAVQVWDVVDDRPDTPLRTEGSVVRSIKVTPNGRWIVLSTQDKDVEVWDLHMRSLKWRTSLQFAGPLALSPEGDRVAFAREDFSIMVWNIAQDKAELILRGHSARINDIFTTSDGTRVISAANDGTVRIWNIAYPAKTSPVRRSGDIRSHGSRVTALTVTPDGKHALSGSIDGVKIWSVGRGITERTNASQNGWVDDIAIRTEAHQVVVLSSRGYGQVEMTIVDESNQHDVKANLAYHWSGVRTAAVYDLETWQEVRVARMNLGDMQEFAKREKDPAHTMTTFGPPTSATPVMVVHKDPGFSGPQNVLTRFEHEGPARDIHLLGRARDVLGRIFVTGSRLIYFDGGASGFFARLWDYESEPQTITFEYPGDLRARAVTPDGRFLVLCAGDGSVKVADLQARQIGASFEEHKTRVYEVVIAPDGHTIMSVSEDGVAFMWDLHTAQQKERSFNLPNQTEIKAITADNQWAFVAPPQSTLVQIPLESTAGTDIRSLDGHTATIHDVAVSPDGDRVLSASEDRTIKLWSLQSGQQLAAAMLDQSARRAVFAVSGDLIMAGDAAGNVYCLQYSRPGRTRQRGLQRKRKRPEISGNDEESP